MSHRRLLLTGAIVLSVTAIVAFTVILQGRKGEASAASDPRTAPVLVKTVNVTSVSGVDRSFTGTIAARIQSNLGFRVPGKIIERCVDVGQQVKRGQPLMRIDETDLQLALTARRNAVAAVRAVLVQSRADEKRYAVLVKDGLGATPQRYEQAKSALDTAQAQFDAAEADAKVAENQAAYSTLVADADGTVVATFGETGQVVAAGQTVIQLAQAGQREALVALPETVRPTIGSVAVASVYGSEERRFPAHLRQISDAADAQSRTYEARYVLEGDAAAAPLGATVTIRLAGGGAQSDVSVPIGALIDDGNRTGVWAIDEASSRVRFVPVTIKGLGEETAVVSGIGIGKPIVALGAHLLKEGAAVSTDVQAQAAQQ
jgi:RND family efflux transporter MFP subunit